MTPFAGIVGVGIHVLVYVVDAISFCMYARSAQRLYCRRRSDALVPGRLSLVCAILVSLLYSAGNQIGTEHDHLSLSEPTQILVGILLIYGWLELVDTWFAASPRHLKLEL